MENSPNPTTRLFVGSLPYRLSESDLLSLFAPFGRITFLRIMRNQWGKSRGLGFVEFDNLDSAIKAKQALHHSTVGDRTMIVDYAQPDPLLTPEGQARHQEKLNRFAARHPQRQNLDQPVSSRPFPSAPASGPKPFARRRFGESPTPKFGGTSPKKYYTPQRQSVYDQRHHHSSVGKKFAAKTRRSK